MTSIQRPAPMRTDGSNAFAHHTIGTRIPETTVKETLALNPDYPPAIREALYALGESLRADAPIRPLKLPAPDHDEWMAQYRPHAGETWLNSEWFFAEVYFYRLMIEVTRWWETGRDPYAPRKVEEVGAEAFWLALEAALATVDWPTEERLQNLIQHALWGNRIDLSFKAALAHGTDWHNDDLLVDDSAAAVTRLLRDPAKRQAHIVNDNTGTELATDLALADGLLAGAVDQVTLHVKLFPTFVSDAIVPDVLTLIDVLRSEARHPTVRALGERLTAALNDGRLRLAPDGFWNSTYFGWEMPPRLQAAFSGSALTVIKGDANYRRIIGDALWHPETPFAQVMAYFPGPVLALRTSKSDGVVGLPAGTAERLSAVDPKWHTSGRYGLMQFKP